MVHAQNFGLVRRPSTLPQGNLPWHSAPIVLMSLPPTQYSKLATVIDVIPEEGTAKRET